MKLNERKAQAMEAKRKANAQRYLSNADDCGRFGRAFELSCARPLSNKTTVAKQGVTDVSVKFKTATGYKYEPCECKTNGGRIDDLLDGTNKSRYVLYRMDTTQKHKATKSREEWVEVRRVEPVIIQTHLFLAILKRFNAIKEVRHGGVVDGLAIQVSNKKLYAWLKDYPMRFDREAVYEEWEFEGVY